MPKLNKDDTYQKWHSNAFTRLQHMKRPKKAILWQLGFVSELWRRSPSFPLQEVNLFELHCLSIKNHDKRTGDRQANGKV